MLNKTVHLREHGAFNYENLQATSRSELARHEKCMPPIVPQSKVPGWSKMFVDSRPKTLITRKLFIEFPRRGKTNTRRRLTRIPLDVPESMRLIATSGRSSRVEPRPSELLFDLIHDYPRQRFPFPATFDAPSGIEPANGRLRDFSVFQRERQVR